MHKTIKLELDLTDDEVFALESSLSKLGALARSFGAEVRSEELATILKKVQVARTAGQRDERHLKSKKVK